ncbi:hypothetical protein D3C87_2018760 [compost metagenome]
MSHGPKVDCLRILNEIVKANRLRDLVPDGCIKPQRQCEQELHAQLRRERLAMTDWDFRRKYLEYIK